MLATVHGDKMLATVQGDLQFKSMVMLYLCYILWVFICTYVWHTLMSCDQ